MPKSQKRTSSGDRQLYSGLIRLHVLHHAAEKPVFGHWLIEELGRHGYKLSAGTLYPLLHGMEKKGYLRSVEERYGKLRRRVYRTTDLGEAVLQDARHKIQELFSELFERADRDKHRHPRRKAEP